MLNDNLIVAQSKVNGFGVFTKKKILSGETFYIVPMNVVYDHSVPHCAKIGKTKWVSDERILNYVNHSCEPNIKLEITSTAPVLIALRDIFEGEELVCDYSETENGNQKIECTCGAKKCRKYFSI